MNHPLMQIVAQEAKSWVASAACRDSDPESFYPPPGSGTGDAKRICMGCPVRIQCLRYAFDTGDLYGVWGGVGPQKRAQIQRDNEVEEFISNLEESIASAGERKNDGYYLPNRGALEEM